MDRSSQVPQLSPRELQLIQYAAQGFTDTAIALKLGISEATVGTYWGRVRIKIGPYNRTELVSIFLRAQQEEALNELREQNAKLLAELHRPGSTEGSFRSSVVQNAPDAMILVDSDGILRSANLAAMEMFGYGEGEMDGLSLLELIPSRFRAQHRAHREEYVSNPRRRSMGEHLETPAIRKDGTEFLVRAALSAIAEGEDLMITCVLREVNLDKEPTEE